MVGGREVGERGGGQRRGSRSQALNVWRTSTKMNHQSVWSTDNITQVLIYAMDFLDTWTLSTTRAH